MALLNSTLICHGSTSLYFSASALPYHGCFSLNLHHSVLHSTSLSLTLKWNWRCVQLHGLDESVNTNFASPSTGGTSLAYEWRLLPRYISKQCLDRCRWRFRRWSWWKWQSYTYVLLSVQILTMHVGTERSDPRIMRKTCFLLFKPYLQLRETLLSNSILSPVYTST